MIVAALSILSLGSSAVSIAGPREDLINQYAAAAKASNPAFAGFSVARGELLHKTEFAGGKPATRSCVACHANDPRGAGNTPLGKAIEPMAVSASPSRYLDSAKVDKWFKRNCNDVLGRECTPIEKGDWLTFVISR
jgi:cytochrome c553